MILGVCEWLSDKLGWRVGYIRLGFLVSVLLVGAGIGLYLVLWIVKALSK